MDHMAYKHMPPPFFRGTNALCSFIGKAINYLTRSTQVYQLPQELYQHIETISLLIPFQEDSQLSICKRIHWKYTNITPTIYLPLLTLQSSKKPPPPYRHTHVQ